MNHHKNAGKLVEAAIMPLINALTLDGRELLLSKKEEEDIAKAGQMAVDAKYPGRYLITTEVVDGAFNIGVRDLSRN